MKDFVYTRVLLVHKARHRKALELAREVERWLAARGCAVSLVEAGEGGISHVDAFDCVIVLGGDGTMLGVARSLVGRKIPVMGINFGRVGFLAHAQPEQWEEKLTACLEGAIPICPSLALTWEVRRGGQSLERGAAVNDIVLSRSALARLVCVDIAVNGESMGLLRSDGLIISTPVGSSGYSVSAGGPLLYSCMDAVVLTPICPFLNTISPLVFPAEFVLRLRIEAGSTDCCLTVDGQEGLALELEDVIEVSGLPRGVHFVGTPCNFIDRLQKRGFVLESARPSGESR